MVLRQGALQDMGKGAEGAHYGGAAGATFSSSDGFDDGGMVLRQGDLQDMGKGAEGAEGAHYGGAAGATLSSSEGVDDGGMMSWARRRSE